MEEHQERIQALKSQHRLSDKVCEVLDLIWGQKPYLIPGASPVPKFIPIEPFTMERIVNMTGHSLDFHTLKRLVANGFLTYFQDKKRSDWCGYIAGPLAPDLARVVYDTEHDLADQGWREIWPNRIK